MSLFTGMHIGFCGAFNGVNNDKARLADGRNKGAEVAMKSRRRQEGFLQVATRLGNLEHDWYTGADDIILRTNNELSKNPARPRWYSLPEALLQTESSPGVGATQGRGPLCEKFMPLSRRQRHSQLHKDLTSEVNCLMMLFLRTERQVGRQELRGCDAGGRQSSGAGCWPWGAGAGFGRSLGHSLRDHRRRRQKKEKRDL